MPEELIPIARRLRSSRKRELEPYKLRRWKRIDQAGPGRCFTSARPGPSKGKAGSVPDKEVHRWIAGLPGSQGTVIFSLLGRKPDGQSEFGFYSFYGGFERAGDRPGLQHFQEWLDRWHPDRAFELFEYPTVDFEPIQSTILDQVTANVAQLLDSGRTVVIIDSGGEVRVRPVCKQLNLVEDTASYNG